MRQRRICAPGVCQGEALITKTSAPQQLSKTTEAVVGMKLFEAYFEFVVRYMFTQSTTAQVALDCVDMLEVHLVIWRGN